MTTLIGIAGGSASGKTSIALKLCDYFKEKGGVLLLRQDDYYKDQSSKTMEQRIQTNYDHPDAFDTDLLVEHIHQLKGGHAIDKPTYDYTRHTRSDIVEHLEAREVIILEGIFVLGQKEIRDLCDVLVYVDTESDVRFIRRLIRDTQVRGRSVESVCNQYLNTVKPMHDQFIEPSKRYAHIIVPEGGHNHVAIDLLITKIASILH